MINQLVLVIQLCTFSPKDSLFPHLTECRVMVIPAKDNVDCVGKKDSWSQSNTTIPHFFKLNNVTSIKDGSEVIVSEPSCQVLPVKSKPFYKKDGGSNDA